MTSTGYPGHLLPLVPFGRACVAAGHDVLIAAPRSHEPLVKRTGLRFWGCSDPPAQELARTVQSAAALPVAEGHALMMGEGFGRIGPRAMLPDVLQLAGTWRADVILSETQEPAGFVAAERRGVPHMRVALGLASTDDETHVLMTDSVNDLRAECGLPSDPEAERIRASPYLTLIPPALESPGFEGPPATHRFQTGKTNPKPLPDWWPGSSGPLVYLTFGSVAASLGFFPELYRRAIDSLAQVDARVLVTLGEAADPAELGPLPPNAHVERWVAQEDVAAHVDAIVSHAGYGSMLGALANGVPQVAIPLFGGDQWHNAGRLAELGAGVALGDASRGMFDPPPAEVVESLPDAVERVLGDPAFRSAAGRIAAAMAALPTVDAAPEVLRRAQRRYSSAA